MRTDGWVPNFPEFSLAKYEEVIEMLDYIRTYVPNNPIPRTKANQIIDQYRHLVHELGMLQYELELSRRHYARLVEDSDQLRAEHAHEREMTQHEIARLSAGNGKKQLQAEEDLKALNDYYGQALVRITAERDKAREALKQVEWVEVNSYGDTACPWCGKYSPDGHLDDCPRQRALEASHE